MFRDIGWLLTWLNIISIMSTIMSSNKDHLLYSKIALNHYIDKLNI